MTPQSPPITEVLYEPKGAARDLFRACTTSPPPPREVLIEGPAGTGKTRAVCELDNYLCEENPGLRVLWVRAVRADMAETVLRTFEEIVLPPNSPLLDGRKRTYRLDYEYDNGSKIVIGGMDNPNRFRSGEYDLVRVFEASEISEDDWEMLLHRIRGTALKLPDGTNWGQALADTNPDAVTHWLNQRAERGMMTRYVTTHRDNPSFWDYTAGDWTPRGHEYVVETLGRLTGVRRARYLDGRWATAEGAIYPEFHPSIHVRGRSDIPRDRDGDLDFDKVIAGVDWGHTAPGAIEVLAIDRQRRLWRVEEVYHTRRTIDWWVQRALDLQRRWKIQCFACDPAEPGYIDQFKHAGLPTTKADNDFRMGIDSVRGLMDPSQPGGNRLFLVRDCTPIVDEELASAKAPRGLLDELPVYTYARAKDGKPIPEECDRGSVDHACDALRYGVRYAVRIMGAHDARPGAKNDDYYSFIARMDRQNGHDAPSF